MALVGYDTGQVKSHRDSSCTGKIRFPSKHKAKIQKRHLKSVYHGKPVPLEAYPCAYCAGFHLGNRGRAVPLTSMEELFILMGE